MSIFTEYSSQFAALALFHLAAVASPGPDFAVIVRQSLRCGRKASMWTAVGIGLGLMAHTAYILVGLGVLIAESPAVFGVMKIVAGGYLMYLGVRSLLVRSDGGAAAAGAEEDRACSWWGGMMTGFLTNALNPKAALFMLSVFTTLLKTETPGEVKLLYGVYVAVASVAWFVGLSAVLSHARVRGMVLRAGPWVERMMGAVLLLLAGGLLVSQIPASQ